MRKHEKHLGLVRWWARDQELMWRTRKPSRVGAGRTSVNWGLAGATLGLRGSAGPAAGKPAGTCVPGRAAVSRLSEHVQSCSALSKSTPYRFPGRVLPASSTPAFLSCKGQVSPPRGAGRAACSLFSAPPAAGWEWPAAEGAGVGGAAARLGLATGASCLLTFK